MKKILCIAVCILTSMMATAGVSKTIKLKRGGELSTSLTANELLTVTNLTVTGIIDARDLKTMRDDMPALAVLDLGAVSIKSFTGSATNPHGVFNYSADKMPEFSFHNGNVSKHTLKTIIFPATMTAIGHKAFYNCSGLAGSLTLPNAVTSIEGEAFENCKGLTGSLTLPNSVVYIGNNAFKDCTGFTGSLTLPNSLTTIGHAAFRNCSGFTGTLTLPNLVSSIGEYAFADCSGFKIIKSFNITPPTLSQGSFENIYLSVIYVPSNAIATYRSTDRWYPFFFSTERAITIHVPTPGGLSAAIDAGGFGPFNSISHLTVTGVLNSTDIYEMKTYMTILTAIDLSGATITSNALPDRAFQGRSSLSSVILPSNLLSIGDYAFDDCVSLEGELPIPASVQTVGEGAFQFCANLTGNLTLPNSITSIGESAFYDCSGFTGSLTLPNSITSIGSDVFWGCKQLSGKIEIPLSVTSIGEYAFADCAKITELSAGKNLISIGDHALSGCSSLAKISVARTTAPTAYANTFSGIAVESCTVEVPKDASPIYQAADYWKMFTLYTETAPTGNFSITLSIGANGSVMENNITLDAVAELSVAPATSLTFTFVPETGYKVASVNYAGIDVSSQSVDNQFTTPAIDADATLNVIFSKIQYRLSIKSAETGTVNWICEHGDFASFDFTPSADWEVSSVFFNNVEVTDDLINGVFTSPTITQNSALIVSFVSTITDEPELINHKVKVYSTTTDIIIEGNELGETILLYTVDGKQLVSLKSQSERTVIPAEKNAVYLLKTGGKTFKVML